MLGFINRVGKVIWPPKSDSSADVSSVNLSSERIQVTKVDQQNKVVYEIT